MPGRTASTSDRDPFAERAENSRPDLSLWNVDGVIMPRELGPADAQEVVSRADSRQVEVDLQNHILSLPSGSSFCADQRLILRFEEADLVLTLFAADGEVDLEDGGVAGDRQPL